MFIVFDSSGVSSEQIGKAEPIKDGFKVKIFNGEATYLLREGNHHDKYHVYKKINDRVIKRFGFGSWLKKSNQWIEFDLGNHRKAYIKADLYCHISPLEWEEVAVS